jgi:hypothetical protein
MTGTVTDEVFAAVFDLVKLAADPAGCAKRIAELKARLDEVAAAEAKLDRARAAFDQERADIEQRKEALRDREVAIAGAETLHQHHHSELVELAQAATLTRSAASWRC